MSLATSSCPRPLTPEPRYGLRVAGPPAVAGLNGKRPRCFGFPIEVYPRCWTTREGHLRFPSLASLSSLGRPLTMRSPLALLFAPADGRSLSTAGRRCFRRAGLSPCARHTLSSSPQPLAARSGRPRAQPSGQGVCCTGTRLQSKPFSHWSICPLLSMAPGRH
jgi:hypothetical protein